MAWFARRGAAADERVEETSSETSGVHVARTEPIDGTTLAVAMLRAFGRDAFDVDERSAEAHEAECEAWAAHLVDGAAPPPGASDGGRSVGTNGARRFFFEARKREAHFVVRAFAEVRRTITELASSLSRAIDRDARGDDDARGKLERLRAVAEKGSLDELRREACATADALTRALDERRERHGRELLELGTRLAELGAELDDAKRKGERDPLTQLLNRGAFDEFLERTAQLTNVYGQPAILLLADLDHFKRVNDHYGHACGDATLRAVADALSKTFLRKSDCVARFGGEELAVIVRDVQPKEASVLAHRLLEAVRRLDVRVGDASLRVTTSVGVACSKRGETPAQWLERADRALYSAKQHGRDRAVVGE